MRRGAGGHLEPCLSTISRGPPHFRVRLAGPTGRWVPVRLPAGRQAWGLGSGWLSVSVRTDTATVEASQRHLKRRPAHRMQRIPSGQCQTASESVDRPEFGLVMRGPACDDRRAGDGRPHTLPVWAGPLAFPGNLLDTASPSGFLRTRTPTLPAPRRSATWADHRAAVALSTGSTRARYR